MVAGKLLALLLPGILALSLGNQQMVVDNGQNLFEAESGPDCRLLNNTKSITSHYLVICTTSNSWLQDLKEYFTINIDCERRRILIGFSVSLLSDGDSQEILTNQYHTFDLSFFRIEIFFKVSANTTYTEIAVYVLRSDKDDEPLLKLTPLIPFDLFSHCSNDTNHSIDNSTLERIMSHLRGLKISHQTEGSSKLWLIIPILRLFLCLIVMLCIIIGRSHVYGLPTQFQTPSNPYNYSIEEKELLIPL
ncbi:hypothetical protein RF11_07901 [Thelohanellus kitauei]|uniref:Uncharacterized protein n=1 Tax=Thelohanellus kitauei TaxID=669202 RepID=A0A0C2M895_THEKT|nr:hypothetical protein RF11_07901 [Thelohanellus kitauei]